jgi:hypothetical protein
MDATRTWVSSALTLGLLFSVACGDDGRTGSDLPTDMGPVAADDGGGRDSGGGLASEGESCADDFDCEPDLGCVSFQCAQVGAEGQPCGVLDSCDADLICDASDTCRRFGMVRLCHCIYTSTTMSPVDVEMQVGDTLVGPTPPDLCTPCVPVPVGTDLPLEIRRTENGAVLESGTLDVDGTVEPAIGIVFSAGVFEAQVANCETVTGFCG